MKILISQKDSNPYQALLYEQMEARGHNVRYLISPTKSATINLLTVIPSVIWYRLRGYTIFHMHWTVAFGLQNKIYQTPLAQKIINWQYIIFLWMITHLGYKFVWTAHNVLPHEPVFADDIAARRALVARADLVIGHSRSTLEGLTTIGARPKKFVVIPHGSYIGVYPNKISRDNARAAFGIDDKTFVYAYIGQVRGYKGVDLLLDTHAKLTGTKLIIAGECHEQALKDRLEANSNEIVWHKGYVDDKDFQLYFAAADVVVLPFRTVTTSGSAILALSFGRAIIVPSIGDLALLPDDVKITYSAADPNGLSQAMKYAQENTDELRHKEKNALQYARSLSWDKIATQTEREYMQLLNIKRESR